MGVSRLDLNLLLTLDAVISERSVARAAERLNVTASAVSNALARLRHELGDPLVVRSGRGVVLTPRAMELAPALRAALESIERAVRNGRFDPKATTRRFVLAMADAGQLSQLPSLARTLAEEMPAASLRVVGIDTYLSMGGVSSADVDAAITRDPGEAPGVHACVLYEEPSVLVARSGHPLACRHVTTAALDSLRHVDVELAPGRGFRGLEQSYAQLGLRHDVAMVVPSFVAAAAVVAQTEWVATLPVSLVQGVGRQFGLVALNSDAPTPCTPLNLVWHERTHADPASRAFRALVKRSMGPQAA